MKLVPTPIAGCSRVQVQPIHDDRGSFTNLIDLDAIRRILPDLEVVRLVRSQTRLKGTIRGLHFQNPPMAEDKVVQCLRGAVFDVCVDIRKGSPTHGQWVASELTEENQELLLIPKGCAHGFQTLRDDCLVEYLLSERYSPPHEGGVRWDDPAIGIAWPLPCTMTSKRDAQWPLLER
jgi:dTDP-4-dehydrorhamnose 3,5-epimerase